MALSPRLELKHSQTLVMTPQLQQAIKLLQYTNLELSDFIAQEVERNPLLEIAEAHDDHADHAEEPSEGRHEDRHGDRDEHSAAGVDGGASDGANDGANDGSGDEGGLQTADAVLLDGVATGAEALDTDFENIYTNDSASDLAFDGMADAASGLSLNGMSIGGGSTNFADADTDFTQNLSAATSLKDHLEAQLGYAQLLPTEQMIGHFLIDMVDDAGYLRGDLGDVSEKLAAPMAEVEAVLRTLQGFDPVGVFARDLRECLALQLKELDRLDPAMATLLDHLELLARRDFASLRRHCGVDGEDLAEMIAEIQALNPRPGLAFTTEEAHLVVPDVLVRRGAKGNWLVELNTASLPRVLLNTSYHAEIVSRAQSKDDKVFISECFSTANWLVKALDQRARTILKVATEIVRQQEGFFLHGIKYLRPLNLRAVADAISMHESTVSRVTTNKYMATERGIFEMKYFFTSAIPAAGDGEAHSAEAVKQRIKELIDAEAADDILSDDKLVDILRRDQIEIARRTVAKYREALKIPSSVQRRRQRALMV